MDEVNTQEQIMSPSPAHKLLNPMNESPSYPTLNFDEIGTPLLPTGLDKTILDSKGTKERLLRQNNDCTCQTRY